MNRLLVIANLYHASPRIPGLTGYLADHGWEVTVVTPPLGGGAEKSLGLPAEFLDRVAIAEAPYKGDVMTFWRTLLRRAGFRGGGSLTEQVGRSLGMGGRGFSLSSALLIAYQTVFAFPDTERTWRKPAIAAALRCISENRFDLILSSSPFPTSHRVARAIASRCGLPWVADFRDPWTPNHAYPFPWFRRIFEEIFERYTMRPADHLIAAADAYAEKIGRLHQRRVSVITNGFHAAADLAADPPSDGPLTICYTGTIYRGRQNPDRLLRVIGRLLRQGRLGPADLELRFYGASSTWLQESVEAHGVSELVRLVGRVPPDEIALVQCSAHVLLLLNWEDPNSPGVLPTKLFEYLAARRPIFATGGFRGDQVERIIDATRAGTTAVSDEEIEHSLMRWVDEYRAHGAVSYEGDREAVSEYSYAAGARKLAGILDGVVRGETVQGGAGTPVAASG